MGRRSSVYRLPPDLRHQLDRRLEASGGGNLTEIAAWASCEAAKRGLDVTVSRSAVGRYGRAMRGIGNPAGLTPAEARHALIGARRALRESAAVVDAVLKSGLLGDD